MSVTLMLIVFFLAVSVLLYVLLAGADFGAGILEWFIPKSNEAERKVVAKAIAPVWEANHVWLVLAAVILFMGLPAVYLTVSTYLYIPLMAILMGIVARGSAFTFRYYDTLTTRYHRLYGRVFSLSSLWTSWFLGVLAGALTLGRLDERAADFSHAYVTPWANLFCFSMGVFACSLFTFLAAVYLVGESGDENVRRAFVRKIKTAWWVMLVGGGLVFLSAEVSGLPLLRMFSDNRVSLGAFVLATLNLGFFGWALNSSKLFLIRLIAASIVGLVLLGWYAVSFPYVIRMKLADGTAGLTIAQAAAPQATLNALLWALIFGSALIFPALFYLFRLFKRTA